MSHGRPKKLGQWKDMHGVSSPSWHGRWAGVGEGGVASLGVGIREACTEYRAKERKKKEASLETGLVGACGHLDSMGLVRGAIWLGQATPDRQTQTQRCTQMNTQHMGMDMDMDHELIFAWLVILRTL